MRFLGGIGAAIGAVLVIIGAVVLVIWLAQLASDLLS